MAVSKAINTIEDDERLLEWLDTIEAKEATRNVYTIYISKFCECVGKTPTELIDESIREVKEGKLPAERKAKGYVARFKKLLSDEGYAPNTRQAAMAALKSFYNSYDMPLSNSVARYKKVDVLEGNNSFLKREDVITLITNTKNLREKAIILTMASSGMAIGEIIDLKVGEIEFDKNNIGTVRIRREKEHVDYTTFISPEATIAIQNYWNERNRDKETRVKGTDDFVFIQGKGNQLNPVSINILFHIMGEQLGYKNKNGFIKSRSHALRKYFASTLEDNGFPKPKIDFMMGHTVSEVDKAYFNRDPEKLKELYISYLSYLTFEKTIEVKKMDVKRLEALEQENAKLKEEMKGTEDIKKRLKAIELIMDDIEVVQIIKALKEKKVSESDKAINESLGLDVVTDGKRFEFGSKKPKKS